jgi:two-component system, cell cycle response regulator DivK
MVRPDQRTILIVDDFQDALDIYGEFLAFRGFQPVTAVGGAEAIAAARAHQPAVIFMDLRMPNMTGEETLRHLRSDPQFSAVPVVALTAHALEDERVAALLAGFDEVITKPCLPDDLIKAAERLMAKGRAQSAAV